MTEPVTPLLIDLFAEPVAFRALIDVLPIGVAMLDSRRRILLTNHALDALTGFDLERTRGLPCHYVMRTDFCLRDCPAIAAGARDQPTSKEGDLINVDRRKIPIRAISTVVRDAGGEPVGFLETFEDISNLEASEEDLATPWGGGRILGRSHVMESLFRMIPMVAQTDSSILITGETGAGKDLLAEVIHQASQRAGGSFVKVNCGALPETLLESELFGHARGAFTGAVDSKPGRIRLAHNGSLYLTEIGDLPLLLQVKLLTFLDDKVVYPLGTTRGFHADVRVIAATHRDLEAMVRRGEFREDLLYRLNVVRLHMPPLREREDDVTLLLDHFMHHYATRFGKPVRGFTPQARQLLRSYPHPGNVRELRNIVEYAVLVCDQETVGVEHLPAYLIEAGSGQVPPADSRSTVPVAAAQSWQEVERKLILDALVRAGGRRGKAAEILGWGRSTLWRKLKLYGISS